jgi:hypothetical protein
MAPALVFAVIEVLDLINGLVNYVGYHLDGITGNKVVIVYAALIELLKDNELNGTKVPIYTADSQYNSSVTPSILGITDTTIISPILL